MISRFFVSIKADLETEPTKTQKNISTARFLLVIDNDKEEGKMGIELEDLREIERSLKLSADLLLKVNDRRILSFWSEYFVASQIKEHRPDWEVKVTGFIGGPDIMCIKNDEKKRIQVKTGRWQRYRFGSDIMYSADASFGKGTQIRSKRFDYLAFMIVGRTEIREILIFSIDELQEVNARPTMAGDPKGNPCLLFRVESIEKLEKWIKYYNITDPIYEIERLIIEKPEDYVNKWEKIWSTR